MKKLKRFIALKLFSIGNYLIRDQLNEEPDGIPYIRSYSAICEFYEPFKNVRHRFECFGDGHYLCSECNHHCE